MSERYSEIDESSFDAEELLNPRSGRSVPRTEQTPPVSTSSTSSTPAPRPVAPEPVSNAPQNVGTAAEDDAHEEDRYREPLIGQSTLRKLRMFAGIVLFLLSAYTLIVTISYFANLSHDQSALLGADYDPYIYSNAGGVFGAWMSHFLLYEWLGVGSFIFIYYLGAISLKLLNVVKFNFWGFTFKCLLSAVAISIIGGFLVEALDAHTRFYWGGLHGYMINHQITLLAGIWGALGLSVIMAALLVIMFIDSLSKIGHWVGDRLEALRERRRREQAEFNARREEAARQQREAGEAAADEPAEPSEDEGEDRITAAAEREDEPLFASESYDETNKVVVGNEESLFEDEKDFSEVEVDTDTDVETFTDTDENLATAEQPAEMVVEKPVIEQCTEVSQPTFYDPTAELSHYVFPTLDLLRDVAYSTDSVDAAEMEENKNRITKTLGDYGIPISHIHATVGPTVTLYEIIPAEGVRIAKIKRLEDDIAMSLAALGIRIIAPIPGKGTIGIEVPNKDPQVVSIRSILASRKFQESKMDLPMALGCTISNDVFMADLTKMPHLLVAGATGMGKSVGLNTIIASLLYKKHPAELKFVLIDPKMVEFSLYASLERHYLAKLPDEEDAIITDPLKVVATLNSLCIEMDNRYALLKSASCRNIKEYNERIQRGNLMAKHEEGHRYLPYIVVIVDEFADLIMTAGKEVETPIARIAQKARAVGIHMILATQRPSTNVITGVIKANFPGRIAFRVFQMVDSRTILDRPGANQLIGRGDMLFSNNGKIERVQCAFIDTPEVEAVCDCISHQVGMEAYPLPEYVPDTDAQGGVTGNPSDRDPLFGDAARYVVQTDTASTSSLQRRYSIGYNRAGKIMDQLEAAGIVGPSQGGKPRQVLMDTMQVARMLGDE